MGREVDDREEEVDDSNKKGWSVSWGLATMESLPSMVDHTQVNQNTVGNEAR